MRGPRAGTLPALMLGMVLLIGCGGGDKVSGPPPAAPARIHLESSAFGAGATIPGEFTCDGAGRRPPLRWTGVPRSARSLALLVEDPDAPGGTFVHWTAWGIAPSASGLSGKVPPGAKEGENSFGDTGWGAPCPPEDASPHRYVFRLYALRHDLPLDRGAEPGKVRNAIADEAIAQGALSARYGR
jgi:Raf kinase inhibitor-like YbhB/YbcL family protein